MNDNEWMRQAIEVARKGVDAGQTPFGAVIVRDDTSCAANHNTVWLSTDPTAHAEVNAIRAAARQLQTIDLRGCRMYTTCEPCPMCLAAIHWSKIDVVYYGATIGDAVAAGFSELRIDAEKMVAMGGSPLRVAAGPLRAECTELFRYWRERGISHAY